MQVDAALPAGNMIAGKYDEASRTQSLEKEMRDTAGNWFYWKFRAVFTESEAAQRTEFQFRFENGPAMGECGPAYSTDCGRTWQWLGAESVQRDPVDGFTFTCIPGVQEVWFCMGIPYLQGELETFLLTRPDIRKSVLCRTKRGRDAELLTIPGGGKKLFLTCRHHACEMMASYVMEGILSAIRGYTVYAVPFVDKDGVEDGDQGKYRSPHDHNRDYWNTPVYPETAAIMCLLDEIKPDVVLDLHCPWLHDVGNPNGTSKLIHYLEAEAPAMSRAQEKFGELLKQTARPLIFTNKDKLPFGSEWNGKEMISPEHGVMFDTWVQMTLPDAKLILTMEIPYAKVYDTPILADDARKLGRAFAEALLLMDDEAEKE